MDFNSRVKDLEKETKFGKELSAASSAISTIKIVIGAVEDKVGDIVSNTLYLDATARNLNVIHDFLLKYSDFFKILDKKFGTNSVRCSQSSKRLVGNMKKELGQFLTLVSQKKLEGAHEIFEGFY